MDYFEKPREILTGKIVILVTQPTGKTRKSTFTDWERDKMKLILIWIVFCYLNISEGQVGLTQGPNPIFLDALRTSKPKRNCENKSLIITLLIGTSMSNNNNQGNVKNLNSVQITKSEVTTKNENANYLSIVVLPIPG